MSDVFSLSASLSLDLSQFEAAVAQAEAEAASLESRLQSLAAMADGAVGTLNRLSSAAAEAGGSLDGGALHTGVLAGALGEALRGVSVNLDGEAVGRLVAEPVDRELAGIARRSRWG